LIIAKPSETLRPPDGAGVSRRDVLVGATAAAMLVGSPVAMAATRRAKPAQAAIPASGMPVRRYMAAAVAMNDGRILIAGGYDRPWTGSKPPTPLASAMIFDPMSEEWYIAAEMTLPRARHAAVALQDGRIVVAGGMSLNPTASVEIYDPRQDLWTVSTPLNQARYDHAIVAHSAGVLVVGGSGQSIVSSVEPLQFGSAFSVAPQP
jgi:hypothetical protein